MHELLPKSLLQDSSQNLTLPQVIMNNFTVVCREDASIPPGVAYRIHIKLSSATLIFLLDST